MKNQNIVAVNISFLKTHRDSRILHSRTAKKNLADKVKENNFKVTAVEIYRKEKLTILLSTITINAGTYVNTIVEFGLVHIIVRYHK